ncbi:hypothetical protein [Sulfurimonas sp. HSL3-2]|uniref:hypothetical protein n=1 Tax=Hydrocurvibacter mobilis TaxID=3131936 RepID=UPI0031F9D7F6
MEFNFMSLVSGVLIFVVGIVVKLILDLNLAPILVKWLSYINPVSRAIFRNLPPSLSGSWDVYWETDSQDFINPIGRKQTANIYQFSNYIFCEYKANSRTYCFFAKSKNSYLTGNYWDKKDPLGYHGAFQLKIVNSANMLGRWAGHSNKNNKINTDTYIWKKTANV